MSIFAPIASNPAWPRPRWTSTRNTASPPRSNIAASRSPISRAESGDLNTLVHLWAFKDAGDRAERRAAMTKEPDWQEYVRKNAENGYIVDQRTSLMVPAKFAPIKR